MRGDNDLDPALWLSGRRFLCGGLLCLGEQEVPAYATADGDALQAPRRETASSLLLVPLHAPRRPRPCKAGSHSPNLTTGYLLLASRGRQVENARGQRFSGEGQGSRLRSRAVAVERHLLRANTSIRDMVVIPHYVEDVTEAVRVSEDTSTLAEVKQGLNSIKRLRPVEDHVRRRNLIQAPLPVRVLGWRIRSKFDSSQRPLCREGDDARSTLGSE